MNPIFGINSTFKYILSLNLFIIYTIRKIYIKRLIIIQDDSKFKEQTLRGAKANCNKKFRVGNLDHNQGLIDLLSGGGMYYITPNFN